MKLIIGIVVLGIAAFLWRRAQRQSRPAARKAAPAAQLLPRQSSRFHAVSIAASKSACDAAKAMGDKRFLSRESPHLPLPDCNAAVCECRFIHHRDRRRNEDRRDPYRGVLSGDKGQFDRERRRRPERRNSEPQGYFSA